MTKGLSAERKTYAYDVSAIVLTYHSDFQKLRQTLLSLILQENISMQIIVADDGSEENHRAEIIGLFDRHGFSDYKLVMNPVNRGTVFNYLSALEVAEGEYTKSLSPGDFLTGSDVLCGWLRFMRQKGCEWSFSEIINYNALNGREAPASDVAQPVYVKPYLDEDRLKMRWNYVVLDDAAPGCAFMGRTQLKKRYAGELASAGNKYAEDLIFRMMMFDGVCGGYYPVATVFYEYGTGISTGKSKVWASRIFSEYLRMNALLAQRPNPDAFQRKMLKYTKRKTSAFAMIFVPGKLRRFIRLHLYPRRFPVAFDDSEEWRAKCR